MERRRIDMQDAFLEALQHALPPMAACIRKRLPDLGVGVPCMDREVDCRHCNLSVEILHALPATVLPTVKQTACHTCHAPRLRRHLVDRPGALLLMVRDLVWCATMYACVARVACVVVTVIQPRPFNPVMRRLQLQRVCICAFIGPRMLG